MHMRPSPSPLSSPVYTAPIIHTVFARRAEAVNAFPLRIHLFSSRERLNYACAELSRRRQEPFDLFEGSWTSFARSVAFRDRSESFARLIRTGRVNI